MSGWWKMEISWKETVVKAKVLYYWALEFKSRGWEQPSQWNNNPTVYVIALLRSVWLYNKYPSLIYCRWSRRCKTAVAQEKSFFSDATVLPLIFYLLAFSYFFLCFYSFITFLVNKNFWKTQVTFSSTIIYRLKYFLKNFLSFYFIKN